MGTPISDEEAEAWVRRMISGAEDLYEMGDPDTWQSFLNSKLLAEQDQVLSLAQEDVLARGRAFLQQEMAQAGLEPTQFMVKGRMVSSIRDLITGRFTSWNEAQKIIVPFKAW